MYQITATFASTRWNLWVNRSSFLLSLSGEEHIQLFFVFYSVLPSAGYKLKPATFVANTKYLPGAAIVQSLVRHTVLALYCIDADSRHIWRWQSGGDFVTHGLHPTWEYLAQQNNLWALESWKVTHLKPTCLPVYVQTHLAMININFQAALDKSAPPTAEAVIRERWKSSCTNVIWAENKLGSC